MGRPGAASFAKVVRINNPLLLLVLLPVVLIVLAGLATLILGSAIVAPLLMLGGGRARAVRGPGGVTADPSAGAKPKLASDAPVIEAEFHRL